MPKIAYCLLIAAWISVSGCSAMRGNVVPKEGPTMEQLYDSLQPEEASSVLLNPSANAEELPMARPKVARQITPFSPDKNGADFKRLPNPTLQLYLYPHFAGRAQLPVPGYFTRFTVYERDQYTLSQAAE